MFKNLFSKKPPKESARAFDAMQTAIAGLLIEAARADETYDAREKAIVIRSLSARFALDETGARRLHDEAERIQKDAVDIHRFTRHAKSMSEEDKIALIETLWEVVLSDGERDPHEDALIRRVCGLIYVSDPKSGAARRRVEAKLGRA